MGKRFYSTKTYEHSVGLSCAFRQWRAEHSHCQYLHGYAIQVKLLFEANELDDRNWVFDFGGLKAIKQWLVDTFDHKTLVAMDDPKKILFKEWEIAGLIQLQEVDNVGCERFAEMIFDKVQEMLASQDRVIIRLVEVREHGGNSGICENTIIR